MAKALGKPDPSTASRPTDQDLIIRKGPVAVAVDDRAGSP
jgi:hypothetical protein